MTDAVMMSDAALGMRAAHGLWCSDDDYLKVSVFGSIATGVTVTGRFLSPDGRLSPLSIPVVGPSSRVTPTTRFQQLGCGWLENISVVATAAVGGVGQVWCVVEIVRGPSGTGGNMATLISAPVSSVMPATWPNDGAQQSLSRLGWLRSITGTDPAAGAEISETVPAGARWRFIALRATLVTSATVANRTPNLVFDDGANVYAEGGVNFNHAASSSFQYSFGAVGQAFVQSSLNAQVGVPSNIILGPGHRIRTITGALDAGDNWGAPQYLVEETLEGA